MTIGCLGWGSLIRDQGKLPVRGTWQGDGPELPVEFARQSTNGRVTLVVTEGARAADLAGGLSGRRQQPHPSEQSDDP
jgi:hypothetical protein